LAEGVRISATLDNVVLHSFEQVVELHANLRSTVRTVANSSRNRSLDEFILHTDLFESKPHQEILETLRWIAEAIPTELVVDRLMFDSLREALISCSRLLEETYPETLIADAESTVTACCRDFEVVQARLKLADDLNSPLLSLFNFPGVGRLLHASDRQPQDTQKLQDGLEYLKAAVKIKEAEIVLVGARAALDRSYALRSLLQDIGNWLMALAPNLTLFYEVPEAVRMTAAIHLAFFQSIDDSNKEGWEDAIWAVNISRFEFEKIATAVRTFTAS